MSKSKGTFITAKEYLDSGLNPEYLRYYFASQLSNKIEDINFDWFDFQHKINTDLIGKYINIASRTSKIIQKRLNNQIIIPNLNNYVPSEFSLISKIHNEHKSILDYYENLEYAKAINKILELTVMVNQFIDEHQIWKLGCESEDKINYLQKICGEIMMAFKMISVYLAPVLPETSKKVATFLNLDMKSFNFDSILGFYPSNQNNSELLENKNNDEINHNSVKHTVITINPYSHLMSRVNLAENQIHN